MRKHTCFVWCLTTERIFAPPAFQRFWFIKDALSPMTHRDIIMHMRHGGCMRTAANHHQQHSCQWGVSLSWSLGHPLTLTGRCLPARRVYLHPPACWVLNRQREVFLLALAGSSRAGQDSCAPARDVCMCCPQLAGESSGHLWTAELREWVGMFIPILPVESMALSACMALLPSNCTTVT